MAKVLPAEPLWHQPCGSPGSGMGCRKSTPRCRVGALCLPPLALRDQDTKGVTPQGSPASTREGAGLWCSLGGHPPRIWGHTASAPCLLGYPYEPRGAVGVAMGCHDFHPPSSTGGITPLQNHWHEKPVGSETSRERGKHASLIEGRSNAPRRSIVLQLQL